MKYKDAEVQIDWPDETSNQPDYTETFMVPFKLMGLAIGRDGSNIKKSRKIKGVRSVRNEKQQDGYRFTVIGESQRAVNEARCVLEFKQKTYTVPNHLAGRVIGKNGNAIKEVIDKSSVKKIENQSKEDNAVVTFNIIGSTEAIQRAVLMLNTKLKEIECINERIQRDAVIKKLFNNGRKEISFKGKNDEDRHKKQDKKGSRLKTLDEDRHKNQDKKGSRSKTPDEDSHKKRDKKRSRSKTPDEDCFVFFLKNKMLRRLDYVKKQKQKQRALLKLDKVNVKMQIQCERKLSKRGHPIDFQLLIGDIVHSSLSFTENKYYEDQHNDTKTKTVKAKVKNYIIETDHGHINRTIASFRYNCLGKYIEAAINNNGLNEVLRVGTWTDHDDYRDTGISLGFPEFSNEKGETCLYDRRACDSLDSPSITNKKGEICLEKCKEIESKREDEQSWWLKPQPTKDTWEEWDSDEESGISTELEQFEKDETNARYNCLSDNLTNQLLSVNDETETSVAYNVDDWW